jgi:septum formation inhibitor MinC
MNRITLFFAASIMAIVLFGCMSKPASAPEVLDGGPRGNNVTVPAAPEIFDNGPRGDNVAESANRMVVRDWSDRSLGEMANPSWLLSARRGNFDAFKSAFGIDPAYTCRAGTGINVNRNAALIQADVLFAAQLAQELRTTALIRAGVAADSEIDDGEYTAIRNAALEAKVTLAGFRQVTDFWQQQEVTDDNGRKQVRYAAYIIYACPPDVWDKLVATYLMDIVGRLPEKKTQQVVAGMFEELKADTRREEEKTEAQWQAEIEAQRQAVENQQRLAMAQTPGGVVAARAVGDAAQTQAIEEARTLRTAIRSGNPVAIAAAAVGASDFDAVAAPAAAAGL